MSANISFVKLQGTGNDFIFVWAEDFPNPHADEIRALCDRRSSVGADGVIAIDASGTPIFMRMWNPDGSEAEMCGNGLRCVGAFLQGAGRLNGRTVLQTKAGPRWLEAIEAGFCCGMGVPQLVKAEQVWEPLGVAGTAVCMGNPHLVIVAPMDDVLTLGPKFQSHSEFPGGVNVHCVEVAGDQLMRMRTWERGAGPTLSCGTGMCASVFAMVEQGQVQLPVRVMTPGGDVIIAATADGEYTLSGPVERVFVGNVTRPNLALVAGTESQRD